MVLLEDQAVVPVLPVHLDLVLPGKGMLEDLRLTEPATAKAVAVDRVVWAEMVSLEPMVLVAQAHKFQFQVHQLTMPAAELADIIMLLHPLVSEAQVVAVMWAQLVPPILEAVAVAAITAVLAQFKVAKAVLELLLFLIKMPHSVAPAVVLSVMEVGPVLGGYTPSQEPVLIWLKYIL
jgi:hypothetical protein